MTSFCQAGLQCSSEMWEGKRGERQRGKEKEREKSSFFGVKIYNLPFLCPLSFMFISNWIKGNKFKFEQILKSMRSYAIIMIKSKTHFIICLVPASFAFSPSPGLSH